MTEASEELKNYYKRIIMLDFEEFDYKINLIAQRNRLEKQEKFIDKDFYMRQFPMNVLTKCENCSMVVPKYLPNCINCDAVLPKVEFSTEIKI